MAKERSVRRLSPTTLSRLTCSMQRAATLERTSYESVSITLPNKIAWLTSDNRNDYALDWRNLRCIGLSGYCSHRS